MKRAHPQAERRDSDQTSEHVPPSREHVLHVTVQGPITSSSRFVSVLQSIGGILKTLAWPVFAFVVFIYLRNPVRETAEALPTMLAHSSKVSIGSLTVELREQAKAVGAPQFAELIQGLSTGAVEALLQTGKGHIVLTGINQDNGGEIFLPSKKEMAALIELEDQGLLQWEIPRKEFDTILANIPQEETFDGEQDMVRLKPKRPLSSDQKEKIQSQLYQLTPKGLQAVDLIILAVTAELGNPRMSTSPREKK